MNLYIDIMKCLSRFIAPFSSLSNRIFLEFEKMSWWKRHFCACWTTQTRMHTKISHQLSYPRPSTNTDVILSWKQCSHAENTIFSCALAPHDLHRHVVADSDSTRFIVNTTLPVNTVTITIIYEVKSSRNVSAGWRSAAPIKPESPHQRYQSYPHLDSGQNELSLQYIKWWSLPSLCSRCHGGDGALQTLKEGKCRVASLLSWWVMAVVWWCCSTVLRHHLSHCRPPSDFPSDKKSSIHSCKSCLRQFFPPF